MAAELAALAAVAATSGDISVVEESKADSKSKAEIVDRKSSIKQGGSTGRQDEASEEPHTADGGDNVVIMD